MESQPRNQVVCAECGRVRLETPPGTTILPTLGMALKASGAAGRCDCGRAPHDRPAAESYAAGSHAAGSDAADI